MSRFPSQLGSAPSFYGRPGQGGAMPQHALYEPIYGPPPGLPIQPGRPTGGPGSRPFEDDLPHPGKPKPWPPVPGPWRPRPDPGGGFGSPGNAPSWRPTPPPGMADGKWPFSDFENIWSSGPEEEEEEPTRGREGRIEDVIKKWDDIGNPVRRGVRPQPGPGGGGGVQPTWNLISTSPKPLPESIYDYPENHPIWDIISPPGGGGGGGGGPPQYINYSTHRGGPRPRYADTSPIGGMATRGPIGDPGGMPPMRQLLPGGGMPQQMGAPMGFGGMPGGGLPPIGGGGMPAMMTARGGMPSMGGGPGGMPPMGGGMPQQMGAPVEMPQQMGAPGGGMPQQMGAPGGMPPMGGMETMGGQASPEMPAMMPAMMPAIGGPGGMPQQMGDPGGMPQMDGLRLLQQLGLLG